MLTSPPQRLVEDGRIARYGMFDAPLRDVNLVDARVQGWGPLKRFRFKQWQHFCILHPRGALTFAVVDTGYLRLGWVQVMDRKYGDRYEHHRQAPWLDLGVARSLWDEPTWLSTRGLQITVRNHLDAQQHAVRIRAERTRTAAPVDAHLVCHATATPLVVCLPLGRDRAMYSHKVVLPVEGEIRAGNQTWKCNPAECTAILDIHKAHYPHHTWWHWATAAGFTEDGRRVGFNFTRNVIDQETPHENAAWIDGQLYALTPSVADTASLKMQTRDGTSALSFASEGMRSEDLNLGVIKSGFQQHIGTFSGTLTIGEEAIPVQDWVGLFEDHDARW